jgi:hypothetical protein
LPKPTIARLYDGMTGLLGILRSLGAHRYQCCSSLHILVAIG